MKPGNLLNRFLRFCRSNYKWILLKAFIFEQVSYLRFSLRKIALIFNQRKTETKGKLKFTNQLYSFYGIHRSGWSFAMKSIAGLHNPEGVLLDAFIERTFCWPMGQNIKPYHVPWIGFIHNPPRMPGWFLPEQSNRELFMTEKWKRSLPFCKGLFTLSEYHRCHLITFLDVPVNTLFHPTGTSARTWNRDAFRNNSQKKIVQIGYFLRKLYSIYLLRVTGYQKVFLRKEDIHLDELMQLEARHLGLRDQLTSEVMNSVRVMKFLSNPAYDHLLSENIVFLDLHDASANNTILECIARNTPVLVNMIEPVVEYLGEGYPFYYSSLQEAANKAMNPDLVYRAHVYLVNHPFKNKLTGSYFKESLIISEIYQSL